MSIQATAGIMGMPIEVRIVDGAATREDAEAVFEYLRKVDRQFSPFKEFSETARMSRGEISTADASPEMRKILALCEQTQAETAGYFSAFNEGVFNPSGVVKGYAIGRSASLLRSCGLHDFFVEAGGDIQTSGVNAEGQPWRVGIRNPFDPTQLLAAAHLSGQAIATSGSYYRGSHIYDPVHGGRANSLASVTVVAKDIVDADRYATAAYAMGEHAISFLATLPGIEALVVNGDRTTVGTAGFARLLAA